MGKFKLLSCLLLLMIGACTEQITPTPYTYTSVFTGAHSKTWTVKFLEQTQNGEVAETFKLDACWNDNEYTFYANSEHAFTATSGAAKCSDTEADVINDTWGFNNATATLTMVLPFFTESSLPFIVKEAKKGNMQLEIFLDENNTSSYRIHFESTSEN